MRSDVHSAALKAAAKVAFSVAFIGGCSAQSNQAPAGEPDTSEHGVTASNEDETGKPAAAADAGAIGTSASGKASSEPPCHRDASVPPAPSCDVALASVFAGSTDQYPGTAKTLTEAERACCVTHLTDNDEIWSAGHRWDCCASLSGTDGGTADFSEIGMACTPWGPPVPPAMKRRARRAIGSELAQVA